MPSCPYPTEDFPGSMDGGCVTRVKASTLARYCDPFEGCWVELDEPLRLPDVDAALELGPPLKLAPPFRFRSWDPPSQEVLRARHAQKIAWFVLNGFSKPLEIDVGVPSLGVYSSYLVQDGNHRLAASLYRLRRWNEDAWLPVCVGGSLSYAVELGLLPSEALAA